VCGPQPEKPSGQGLLTLELAQVAARAAATKTLEATTLLDVGDLFGITDHFLITSGRNDRQVKAIVDEVTTRVREAGGRTVRPAEGLGSLAWVLLDFGDFIVHVFSAEARAFYDLERLWRDATRIELDTLVDAEGVAR
jgi:ribosome-associated protein